MWIFNKNEPLFLTAQKATKQKVAEELRKNKQKAKPGKAQLKNMRNIENITKNLKLETQNLRHGNLEEEMQDETRGMTNRRKCRQSDRGKRTLYITHREVRKWQAGREHSSQ